MKELLSQIELIEKENGRNSEGKKIVATLIVWNDNCLSDAYMEDTLGIGVEDRILKDNGETKEYKGELTAMWLTKGQCIILRNHLDSFIALAETEEELQKRFEKEGL